MSSRSLIIRTDERLEAVKGIEMTRKMLLEVKRDIYYWKWVVIALHNAIQNFIVCAISGTDGLGALTEKSARAWLAAHEAGSETYPQERLASFMELYGRMKGRLGYDPGEKVDQNIGKLHHEFRNTFMHYKPMGWSIIADGFPQIGMDCIQVIKFVGWESGQIMWYEKEMLKEVQALHEDCMEILTTLQHEYTGADHG